MSLLVRGQRLKAIGKSLEKYLKQAHDHSVMMERERVEFEKGKRHLANIMGWDVNKPIKQQDIDSAIEYLFPSGLFDPLSRPVMKPPEEILPKFSKFNFDSEGRPADSLFFTLRPRFYTLLSASRFFPLGYSLELGLKAQRLTNYHDERVLKRLLDSKPSNELILTGSLWLPQAEMSKKIGDKLTDEMYAHLILAFEHLCSLPYAHLEKDFIMEYRTSGVAGKPRAELFGSVIPPVQVDEKQNVRFAVGQSTVKRTIVEARVSDAGSGKFFVNGQPYSVFRSLLARECLLSPLLLTNKFGQLDVDAKVVSGPGGLSVIPRAVRHAVSLGIVALHPEFKQKLRFAGLLTADPRRKERSKVNQPGARAKWIWKRR
ncbi:putative 40S ribosomal protein S9, mitochondrial [Aphelenchoides fujianensis]|nr:putative 40S ribosomal protein S9, mitochondrial [Aphelenchoides fujianensis]